VGGGAGFVRHVVIAHSPGFLRLLGLFGFSFTSLRSGYGASAMRLRCFGRRRAGDHAAPDDRANGRRSGATDRYANARDLCASGAKFGTAGLGPWRSGGFTSRAGSDPVSTSHSLADYRTKCKEPPPSAGKAARHGAEVDHAATPGAATASANVGVRSGDRAQCGGHVDLRESGSPGAPSTAC
jgi:hypothetical protein